MKKLLTLALIFVSYNVTADDLIRLNCQCTKIDALWGDQSRCSNDRAQMIINVNKKTMIWDDYIRRRSFPLSISDYYYKGSSGNNSVKIDRTSLTAVWTQRSILKSTYKCELSTGI